MLISVQTKDNTHFVFPNDRGSSGKTETDDNRSGGEESMLKRSKKKIAKIASLILSAALFVPAMYGMTVKDFVRADDTVAKTTSNTKLGVNGLHNPAVPASIDSAWQGSYVYFGNYQGTPIKFRVLDNSTTKYSAEKTMFLDSDRTLYNRVFDGDFDLQTGTSTWAESDIKDGLNGSEFLNKSGVFTEIEKSSIAESRIDGHTLSNIDNTAIDICRNYVGLGGEKVFLLDVEDVCNQAYGYYGDMTTKGNPHPNLVKKPEDNSWSFNTWWLRSAAYDDSWAPGLDKAAAMFINLRDYLVNEEELGVAPALNISHDSILFSTAVKGTYGELGTEYKLTLIDPELQVSLTGDFTKTGLKITVPYSLTGDSVNANTKMSYMFTSKALGEAGNTILAYGTMNQENSQAGSFYLFKGLTGTWGQDYHVYVFAENVNGTYESDYASAPVELAVSNPGPVFSGKTTQNTKLGTKQMKTPAVPQSANDAWNGSFVYFGKYEGQPVLYRVLDPNSNIFGSNTLFLDCDEGLYLDYFDEENQTNNWNDSDIRANLNGDSFLNKDGVFTSAEKASIAESEISGHPLTGILQSAIDTYGNYVGLDGDKVFVLDAEDTFNASYGYCNGCSDILGYTNYNKFYDGQLYACWLRNAAGSWQGTSSLCAGTIPQNSRMEVYADYAVAPALNVSQDSIIFSTAVEGDYGVLGSQYKLTLKDPDIGLTVGGLEVNGRSVSFNYSVNGSHKNEVTQISYLVVKKATGFPKYDTIAAYGAVTLSGNYGGDFELPANLTGDFGTDYKVYILAEDINGTFETDYADMAELTLPKIVFDLTNGPITCDQEQLDALAELYWNGDIDADEPIEDSVDLNRIDVDMDGTWDFELKNFVLTKTSDCSIKTKKEFTTLKNFASVTFIVGAAPRIARHAIRLTGSIGVKFGVDFPDGTDVSKCYVEFVTSTGRKTTVRTSSAGETDSSRYYIFSINCLEMADEITATLYYDGETIQTDTYSAMAYILHVKNNAGRYDERVVDLVDALQKYGYYMQKSDWSDNVSHYAIPKPSRTLSSADVDRATTELNLDALCGIQKNLGTSGISSSMKISLSLTSVTALKLYVKPEDSSVIMPNNAKAVDFGGVTYYEFAINNIGPHVLDTMRTFEITTNKGTATVSLPAIFYVKNMLNKSTTTNDQKLALTAYYQYFKAAKAITG